MFGTGHRISLTILQIQFFRQNRSKSVQNSKKKFIELMYQDKKVENAKINLLVPIDYAQVELFDDINQLSLEACLP